MSARIRAHFQSNVVAYLALFVALGGTTYAATSLPRNSVTTKSIRKGAVTKPKIAKDAVTGAAVKDRSLSGADIDPTALGSVPDSAHATNADNATNAGNAANAANAAHAGNSDQLGGLAPESFLKGADQFPGGDLTGTYAQPTIGAGKVDSSKIADGSIAGADVGANALGGSQINELSLTGVDAGKLGGRSSSEYVLNDGNFFTSAAWNAVNTTTAPANTVVLRASRYELRTTGTAHQFKVCGESGFPDQFFAIVPGLNNVTVQQTINGSACGAAFATGGSGTTSPGNFIVFGPDGVMFGGPSTQNTIASPDASRYAVEAIGFGISAP